MVEGHRAGEVPRITQIYYLMCTVFNKNVVKHGKKHKSTTHIPKKKQVPQTSCVNDQMLDITEKGFKISIINMFTKLKNSMIKEVTEGFIAMLHQLDNTSKL